MVDFIDATNEYPNGTAANLSMEPRFDSEIASVGTLKRFATNAGRLPPNAG